MAGGAECFAAGCCSTHAYTGVSLIPLASLQRVRFQGQMVGQSAAPHTLSYFINIGNHRYARLLSCRCNAWLPIKLMLKGVVVSCTYLAHHELESVFFIVYFAFNAGMADAEQPVGGPKGASQV